MKLCLALLYRTCTSGSLTDFLPTATLQYCTVTVREENGGTEAGHMLKSLGYKRTKPRLEPSS